MMNKERAIKENVCSESLRRAVLNSRAWALPREGFLICSPSTAAQESVAPVLPELQYFTYEGTRSWTTGEVWCLIKIPENVLRKIEHGSSVNEEDVTANIIKKYMLLQSPVTHTQTHVYIVPAIWDNRRGFLLPTPDIALHVRLETQEHFLYIHSEQTYTGGTCSSPDNETGENTDRER